MLDHSCFNDSTILESSAGFFLDGDGVSLDDLTDGCGKIGCSLTGDLSNFPSCFDSFELF